ncbi:MULTISPECIES: very short patch repair endonuclease [Pseudomonadaceae]|uniref:Very short patch repair endonuclease n=2 Tax=Pseudomonas TaxID=286 RepID=A0AAQ3LKV6_PSEAI|nr:MULTISPECIES: very short patch repair endonuclease [Pseudomonadaceae]HBZ93789.1 DNA mismatch endonuclease Vsr [Pseudomonas sp.]EIU4785286.1 DNA mismatch endonuclease Vsr [Pseudomonas aeruginosa]EIU5533784.1 DNA mismatch endonuclease Vsr [Pseudomonas aeruginosa]MDG9759536.1 very short patch repair endonuclease [Pseudomonas sediminis]MDS1043841.1 very short patch repair endonuclease [Pseudomonas aeruginosa]
MDIVSKEVRSRMMAGIRGSNTSPEMKVRRLLHRHGFRYRLHQKDLPGKPDLVLSRYRVCIFVHGCFWHRHPGCRYATSPKTRLDFWQRKFDQNVARDTRNKAVLLASGWRVIQLWECGWCPSTVVVTRCHSHTSPAPECLAAIAHSIAPSMSGDFSCEL